jgi:hypothetical protein
MSNTFELFSSENEALLIGRNALLVLDLSLDSLDRVRGLHVQSDRLARERLHENLHGYKNNIINTFIFNIIASPKYLQSGIPTALRCASLLGRRTWAICT